MIASPVAIDVLATIGVDAFGNAFTTASAGAGKVVDVGEGWVDAGAVVVEVVDGAVVDVVVGLFTTADDVIVIGREPVPGISNRPAATQLSAVTHDTVVKKASGALFCTPLANTAGVAVPQFPFVNVMVNAS